MKGNFIYHILKEIHSGEWYGVSEDVEICKGKYKIGNRKQKIKRRFFYFLIKRIT